MDSLVTTKGALAYATKQTLDIHSTGFDTRLMTSAMSQIRC